MSYADDQLSAKVLLAEAGQVVILTPPSTGTYDPSTGTVIGAGAALLTEAGGVVLTEVGDEVLLESGAAIVTIITIGVVLPLSRGLKHMPGTDIAAGDQQLLLPGDIAQPEIDTKVTIGGADFTIKEVAPLSPGGTALLYDCVIRA